MDIWLVNSFRTGKSQVLLGLCRIECDSGIKQGMWPPLWGLVYQNFTVAALLLKLQQFKKVDISKHFSSLKITTKVNEL